MNAIYRFFRTPIISATSAADQAGHCRQFFKISPQLVLALLLLVSVAVAQAAGGLVFVNGNSSPDNQVWMYNRAKNGQLAFVGAFDTEGNGGPEVGSQGGVALWNNNKILYAVNEGSNEITAFKVKPRGLTFIGKYPSGGTYPNSIATYGNLIYVLNAQGTAGNITGFTIQPNGALVAIPNSTRPLSASVPKAIQVSFTPDGTTLVVTETHTNVIDTYSMGDDGLATGPLVQSSAGDGPFGFVFDPAGHLIVSNVTPATCSSYNVVDGVVQVISSAIPDFNKAACWAAVTNNSSFSQQYVYVTNTNSDNVSGYAIAGDGSLSLLNSDGITALVPKGSFPLDMVISKDSKYLYVLDQQLPGITGFQIQSDGSLVQIQDLRGTPNTSWGITGY